MPDKQGISRERLIEIIAKGEDNADIINAITNEYYYQERYEKTADKILSELHEVKEADWKGETVVDEEGGGFNHGEICVILPKEFIGKNVQIQIRILDEKKS